MRVITFQPFHLSSIQQGIQSGHAATTIGVKFPRSKAYKRWMKAPTIIVKNAGTSREMEEILTLFRRKDNPYPWAVFREEDFWNVITSIAICIPEWVAKTKHPKTDFQKELVALLKRTRLAS